MKTFTPNKLVKIEAVLAQVLEERVRQHARFGAQNHPDGTGPRVAPELHTPYHYNNLMVALRLKEINEMAVEANQLSWNLILSEEVAEALAEDDPKKLRAELVQCAAVCVAWCEAIDRKADK